MLIPNSVLNLPIFCNKVKLYPSYNQTTIINREAKKPSNQSLK